MLNRITAALSISHELFIFFKFKEHLPYVLPACLSICMIAKYSKELIYILLSVRGKSRLCCLGLHTQLHQTQLSRLGCQAGSRQPDCILVLSPRCRLGYYLHFHLISPPASTRLMLPITIRNSGWQVPGSGGTEVLSDIGRPWSKFSASPGLWLVLSDHLTWILASDWSGPRPAGQTGRHS